MNRALVSILALAALSCASSPSSTATSTPTPTATPTSTSLATSTGTTPSPSASNPVVTIGDITSPSTFDPKSLLDDALPRLRECYAAALKVTPSLHGKMMVRVVVNEAGKVTNVEEDKSTTKDAGLFECVKTALSPIAFPKPGGMATILVPLKFKQ